MKAKVLAFLKDVSGLPEERYNEAMKKKKKSEGKSVAQVNSYYRSGFTETNLKNICYDLQQLHGISDVELASKKGKKAKVKVVKPLKDMDVDSLDAVLALMPDEVKAIVVFLGHMPSGDYPMETQELFTPLKEFVEKHEAVFVHEDETPFTGDEIFKTLFVSTEDWNDENNLVVALGEKAKEIAQNGTDIQKNGTDVTKNETISLKSELQNAPDEAKGGLKLRERFSFLGEADCPDKLKILVSDMLTAWDAFKEDHAALMVVTEEGKEDKSLTDAEIYELAKETIEAFQLNHAIWDELEYYNEHKEVLGNHPIFADDKLKEKVAGMSDVDLVNRQKNVRSYISKENRKLKNAKDEDSVTKIKKKIQELNQELNLLDERIGKKK